MQTVDKKITITIGLDHNGLPFQALVVADKKGLNDINRLVEESLFDLLWYAEYFFNGCGAGKHAYPTPYERWPSDLVYAPCTVCGARPRANMDPSTV